MQRINNYDIQVMQAKKRFLTYDQQELISRCRMRFDENYLNTQLLAQDYRICRKTGDMERLVKDRWVDGNSFGEVMTILDWLCDSLPTGTLPAGGSISSPMVIISTGGCRKKAITRTRKCATGIPRRFLPPALR